MSKTENFYNITQVQEIPKISGKSASTPLMARTEELSKRNPIKNSLNHLTFTHNLLHTYICLIQLCTYIYGRGHYTVLQRNMFHLEQFSSFQRNYTVFNQSRELNALYYTLKNKPQWTVVSGPLNSRKSTILIKVMETLQDEKQKPLTIHLDLRSRTFRDVDTFASTMLNQLKSWFSGCELFTRQTISIMVCCNFGLIYNNYYDCTNWTYDLY